MTRGPARGHEPDGTRALVARPAGPPADDAETTVLPTARPADLPADESETTVLPVVTPAGSGQSAPSVPEVPAIGDIAARGRPDVDAVVASEGTPASRRRRPSRHMRARADEMARLVSRAAPRAGGRRGLSSLPAAAVLAAVAVGGVGIVLGIDAQRAGAQIALPGMPAMPADQTPVPETGETSVPTVDTGIVDSLEPDPSSSTAAPPPVSPSVQQAPAAAVSSRSNAPIPPTTSTTTTSPTTTPPDPPTTSTRGSTSSSRPTPREDDGGGEGEPSRGSDEPGNGSGAPSSSASPAPPS